MRKRLEILVVDDHVAVREGLKLIFQQSDECVVAAEAANVGDAIAWLRKRSFDAVMLDISLPDKSGIELLKVIKQEIGNLPVLILSAYREDYYAMRALKEGADGYLNKDSPAEVLIAAVQKVAAGGKYVTPALAERLALEINKREPGVLHEALSDREFEVLKMIAAGVSLKSVAEQLCISPKTVTTYRARIIEKTGLDNNAQLTRYALENNLLD